MRKIKRNIVGAFIFSADDKLLLGKSVKGGVYPGCWFVPGGGVDEGESLEEALKREVLEETGIDIEGSEIDRLDHSHSGVQEKTLRDTGETVIVQMDFFDHVVRLPLSSDQVKIICDDDFTDARWFDKSELPNLKHSPPGIRSLKKLGLL